MKLPLQQSSSSLHATCSFNTPKHHDQQSNNNSRVLISWNMFSHWDGHVMLSTNHTGPGPSKASLCEEADEEGWLISKFLPKEWKDTTVDEAMEDLKKTMQHVSAASSVLAQRVRVRDTVFTQGHSFHGHSVVTGHRNAYSPLGSLVVWV